jgi:hypothetical protein
MTTATTPAPGRPLPPGGLLATPAEPEGGYTLLEQEVDEQDHLARGVQRTTNEVLS